ncbi:MAG: formate dehydrogenase accessory sulfurtransferase FdhD [Candidatus Puniceispirillales bacterium]|jgi:FdhD protein|nr:formate dehydrogenase accessory sulfurtransferase FdhD [Alphaproteobacteria bacterium]
MSKTSIKPLLPNPEQSPLLRMVEGRDENNQPVTIPVVTEKPLTIFLNRQEIVTAMTLGDYPDYLAVGFLKNQNMLKDDDVIIGIDVDEELGVVVVRTDRTTNYEEKLQKKIQTSGCAQGTVFGDMMEQIDQITLNKNTMLRTSTMLSLIKAINTMPSLYLSAGAIHGCVLAKENEILAYIEDVGRHNAVDKIAGWMRMNGISGDDKLFYTTGRLTSEMVIKCVQMRIPVLMSRSGFTQSGVDMARQTGLTLIGRARGKRFTALSGLDRIIDDHDKTTIEDNNDDPLSPQRGMRQP